MKRKLPAIAPTIAPITEPELGSVEPTVVMGAVVWATGAVAMVVTGLAMAVVVVVTGLTIAVVLVAAGSAIAVVDGLGVAAGSIPARRMVVVYVV